MLSERDSVLEFRVLKFHFLCRRTAPLGNRGLRRRSVLEFVVRDDDDDYDQHLRGHIYYAAFDTCHLPARCKMMNFHNARLFIHSRGSHSLVHVPSKFHTVKLNQASADNSSHAAAH